MITQRLRLTQEIRLIHGTSRIKRLAQRPDTANAVRRIRAEMAEANHAYAERKFFGCTREEFLDEPVHFGDQAALGAPASHPNRLRSYFQVAWSMIRVIMTG